MRPLDLFRSGAFRFALLLATVFALGAIGLLLIMNRAVSNYAVEATVGGLHTEIAILAAEDRAEGRPQLLAAIDRHQRFGGDQVFRYLLVDPAGLRIAGTLPVAEAKTGLRAIAVPSSDVGGTALDSLQALGRKLKDGSTLVVATDTYDIVDLQDRLDRFTIAFGIAITMFALVGGWFVGMVFTRRLRRVGAAAERILAGDLTERLPTIGMSPEFDHLSQTLNRMLARIEALVGHLRQVSTDVAHDLRTPLTRLRQELEGLRGSESVETFEHGVAAAVEHTDQILGIFRALLRIGALEDGTLRKHFRMVDLGEIMDRVALAYEPVVEDQRKTLAFEHVQDAQVSGDGELLAQLFINLIENALAHTPPETRITSTLCHVEGQLVATVTDTGPGIPHEAHNKVFQRFYRLDASRTTPGNGLGLSLVAAIAALHNATVRLENNDPGLRVVVTFPVASATVG